MQPHAIRGILCLLALHNALSFLVKERPRFSARKTCLGSLLRQNELIRQKAATSESIVRQSLAHMEQKEDHVRAMLAVYGDRAIAASRRVDAAKSPIAGAPIAVKANLCDQVGMAGSRGCFIETRCTV